MSITDIPIPDAGRTALKGSCCPSARLGRSVRGCPDNLSGHEARLSNKGNASDTVAAGHFHEEVFVLAHDAIERFDVVVIELARDGGQGLGPLRTMPRIRCHRGGLWAILASNQLAHGFHLRRVHRVAQLYDWALSVAHDLVHVAAPQRHSAYSRR